MALQGRVRFCYSERTSKLRNAGSRISDITGEGGNMVSERLHDLIRPQQFLLTLLWLIFTLSIAVYVGVAYFTVPPGVAVLRAGAAADRPPGSVYPIAAALGALAGFLLRRFLLSKQRIQAQLSAPLNTTLYCTNPQTKQVDEQKRSIIEGLTDIEKKLLSVSGRYFIPSVLSLVLNETVGILGLVAAMGSGNPAAILPYAAVGLLLNLLIFPRVQAFVQAVEKNYPVL
jgi:hypothetical protein